MDIYVCIYVLAGDKADEHRNTLEISLFSILRNLRING